ncbi:unnamed protein product [Acidocella sp. C78]|nr:unnamed protein product [Acidocella sp. C78]
MRRLLLAAFAAGAALTLGGCVYYPSSYGYGYGYYAPPPVVYGGVTIGGWWHGDDDGWHRGWHH